MRAASAHCTRLTEIPDPLPPRPLHAEPMAVPAGQGHLRADQFEAGARVDGVVQCSATAHVDLPMREIECARNARVGRAGGKVAAPVLVDVCGPMTARVA